VPLTLSRDPESNDDLSFGESVFVACKVKGKQQRGKPNRNALDEFHDQGDSVKK
jgi:hypothetical protein